MEALLKLNDKYLWSFENVILMPISPGYHKMSDCNSAISSFGIENDHPGLV